MTDKATLLALAERCEANADRQIAIALRLEFSIHYESLTWAAAALIVAERLRARAALAGDA